MPRITRRLVTLVAGLSLLGAAGVLTWTGSTEIDATSQTEALNAYRLTSVNVEDSTLTLAWDGDAEKYRVRIGTDLTEPLLDTTTSDPVASLTTLGARTSRTGTLRYRIDIVTDDDLTQVLSGTLTLPPAAVTKTKITEVASNGLALSWEPVNGVTHYDIGFAKKAGAEPYEIHRISGKENSFRITTMKPKTKGVVTVRPVRHGVYGEPSKPLDFTTLAEFAEFAVGTWNVCSESCSGYASRSHTMARKVNESNMDIMALQEAGGQRVGHTTNATFSGGERGFVRATGGAKTRYIFYREALFDQLGGGIFSIGHGRTVTWARLRELSTDQSFIVVSVHFVPGKSSKKNRERGSQASSLIAGINRVNPAKDPVILAGDFNTGTHRGGDQVMSRLRNAGYSDSVRIAAATEGAHLNSYNNNSTNPRRSGHYVDHIFVSQQLAVPLWRQSVHAHGGRVLTDHNLIAAKVRLTAPTSPKLEKGTPSVLLPTAAVRATLNAEPQS